MIFFSQTGYAAIRNVLFLLKHLFFNMNNSFYILHT